MTEDIIDEETFDTLAEGDVVEYQYVTGDRVTGGGVREVKSTDHVFGEIIVGNTPETDRMMWRKEIDEIRVWTLDGDGRRAEAANTVTNLEIVARSDD